ncbi:MAG: hypothetical protein J6S14_22145 [Clostridia bacterium]|nr:hypothetical protein [Clostridia bacterium]
MKLRSIIRSIINCLFMSLALLFISTFGINASATDSESTVDDYVVNDMVPETPVYVQDIIDEYQYVTYEMATVSLSPGTYTLYTTNNTPVDAIVYVPMSYQEEAAYVALRSAYGQYLTFYAESPEDERITNAYNCHYYAWCADWCETQYWVPYAEAFSNDPHVYTLQDSDILQIGDIVTYWVGDECKHSAVIHKFENGVVKLKSKWGPLGLYVHELDQVPNEYKEYKTNGQLNIKIQRYEHGQHYYVWYSIDDNKHAWKCRGCDGYIAGTAVSHTNSATGTYTESGHSVSCSQCGYSGTEEHNSYIYQDNGESGVTIKCNLCGFVKSCNIGVAEYVYGGQDGHYVDCSCGCYSFFAAHVPSIIMQTSSLSYHNALCKYCGEIYPAAHSWVPKNYGYVQGYECLMCDMFSISIPGVMQIPPSDELLIATSDDLVTEDALLPEKEDDLVTE